MGILAAYTHRLKTGQGQQVDTSLLEAGITHTYWQSAICLVGAANQANWEKLLRALDATELEQDERFIENAGRQTNLPVLVDLLTPYFRTRTTEQWMTLFDELGLPAGPVLSIAEMHADPQTQAREMITEVQHSKLGPVKTLGAPVKFSETPSAVKRGAPLLGEHTREILAEFGYSDAEISALHEVGAI